METGDRQVFKVDGKVISKNRFDDLVSAYLDLKITNDELELLAKLVNSNQKAATEFVKARRIHIATCKMFGKESVKLPRLPIYNARSRNRKRAAAEWSMVVVLMITTVITFRFAQRAMASENKTTNSIEIVKVPNAESFYEFTIDNNFIAQAGTCSLFRIVPRRKDGEK